MIYQVYQVLSFVFKAYSLLFSIIGKPKYHKMRRESMIDRT